MVRHVLLDWAERGWLVPDPHLGVFDVVALPDKPGEEPGPEDWVPATREEVIRRRTAGLARRSGHERRFGDLIHLSALAGIMPREMFDGFAGADLIAPAMARVAPITL